MPRDDLAFLYVGKSTFVRQDLALLQRKFAVREVAWPGGGAPFALARAVAGARASFSWFGGDHAFGAAVLGAVLRRPAMVAVGGLDGSAVPEFGWGVWCDPRSAKRARFTYRRAAGVFPVAEGLGRDILAATGGDGRNLVTIPCAFDAARFRPAGAKEDLVVTAAYLDDSTVVRKGIDTFLEVARRVPEATFAVVGEAQDPATGERLRRAAPSNCILTGAVAPEELLRWYQRAKVYCQLSRHEGHPNALCEAMLCGCAPVATPYYGMPEAVGDAGFLVPWRDPEGAAAAVRDALAKAGDLGARARERIATLYPLERRARELTAAVEAVLAGEPVAALPFARRAA